MRGSTFGYIAAISLAASAGVANAQIAVRNQGYVPFSDAPINYRSNDLHDPVTRLQQQLESGKVKLTYEPEHGYLRSVLQLLQVPADSQTLVFSKTSFQYPKISPEHPRALYFNDDVYVGSVHEGKAIEIVSFDPMQGAIFFLLDENKAEHPGFQRAELDCTQCHIAAGTRGIPGVLLRSVYPTSSGTLATGTRSFITDQESPWVERWGGWYVTGDLAGGTHMGNATVGSPQASADTPRAPTAVSMPVAGSPLAPTSASTAGSPPTTAPNSLRTLPPAFTPAAYLSPGSDVVAHLVLAHQTQMHNLITLTNYKTRLALYSQSSPTQFQRPAEQLLRYLLFSNEASLPDGAQEPVGATSPFAKEFAARGPRDSKGRSLRDFDLRTRIFRYPCSYLIYSESFDALPDPAKEYVYHRLLEVLSGQDSSPDFARLSAADRRDILEILLDTKSNLPPEWRDYAASHQLQLAAAPASSSHTR